LSDSKINNKGFLLTEPIQVSVPKETTAENDFFIKIQTEPKMKKQDLTISFLVQQTAKEAFEAINHVRGWWITQVDGKSEKLNDEFAVQFEDLHYSSQKLIEVIPDTKVVWLVTESNLSFLKNKTEWNGTKISFEIAKKGSKTQIRFTHLGLIPTCECYGDCSNGWKDYISHSLLNLIATGKGQPFQGRKKNKKKEKV
jgi:hypothetical protein